MGSDGDIEMKSLSDGNNFKAGFGDKIGEIEIQNSQKDDQEEDEYESEYESEEGSPKF